MQFEGAWRWRGAEGDYRWFFTRCVPLSSAEGRVVRWYATNTDIEERHRAEEALLKTQSELARLSQSLSLGQLTVSIAHEVGQPLAAVVTNGEACMEWLAADPPNLDKAGQSLRKLVQDGSRAGTILARIRALFQNGESTRTRIDMPELIEELKVFFGGEAKQLGIAIRSEFGPGVPAIQGDRIQIQQVLLNLIMNAMDAMTATPDGQRELVLRATKQMATEITISVEDTGCGLDTQTAEDIFKPFFTTKLHGTGMGLSISRSIVEAHEGRLWATQRPTGGAAFHFTIPVTPENLHD
jgi:C4-dicarboxylate-specific signal transduction histidine kinase